MSSDETEIVSVYAATADDVDIAVKAARTAFLNPTWRTMSGTDRGSLLIKLAALVAEHRETLATIETWDNGKPYNEALTRDLRAVEEVFKYYGGYADKIHGSTINATKDKFAYTIKEPIGVCGQIIPFNYPLLMASWKLGPALAYGNTVVMKPAEQTPLSILYLANLVKEAGFPPGVVNILNGFGKEAGAAIASHLDIDKIAFTGSTTTGAEIMRMAAVNLKNITLETGGKCPLLVFADADQDQAVKWAHIGIMGNQGQVCTAMSRILVEECIYDDFIVAFKKRVLAVSVVGDPFSDTTFQGPQVTKAQYDRVLSYVEIGKKDGASLISGGNPCPKEGKGFYVEPTIFANVTSSMRIFREEVFGPFVVIVPFKNEEEALSIANDSVYGLGASVFTKDLMRAHRVAQQIEAGQVWINSSNDSDFRVPFGGTKQSGIGRELGEAGLASYYNIKAVHVNMGTML